MNSVIQPRHIKLLLGGQAGNWEYAEYERHNIGGALARMAAAIPLYKGVPTDALIASFATPQLSELQSAIEAKDPTAFDQAYDALTTGCNACHVSTAHAQIVIRRLTGNPFPDQAFEPPRP